MDGFTRTLPENSGEAMARKLLMSWEGSPNYRWVKMYRGKRLDLLRRTAISRTKEGSYQAANDWWQSKLATLTAGGIDPERAEQLEALNHKINYAASNAPELVPALERRSKEFSENHRVKSSWRMIRRLRRTWKWSA